MTLYVVLLISSVSGLFYLETYTKQSSNYNKYLKSYFIGLGIIMVMIGTLRSYSVGADTSTYLEYFLQNFYYKIEIGYIALSRLISLMGFSFRVLLLVVQCIVTLPILFIIYKSSQIKWLSLFLYQAFYLYLNSFNIIRQSIAMTFVLIAVYVLLEHNKGRKRNLMFLALIGLATLFHTSAIMFVLMWPVKDYKPKAVQIATIVIASLIVMVFRQPILTFVFSLLNRPYYTDFNVDLGISTIAILILMLGMLVTKDFTQKPLTSTGKFVINLLFGTLFFNLVWAWFPNHARITMYVYLILSIFYPNVLNEQKDDKYFSFKLILLVVVMLGLYIFQMVFRDYSQVIPYALFFR